MYGSITSRSNSPCPTSAGSEAQNSGRSTPSDQEQPKNFWKKYEVEAPFHYFLPSRFEPYAGAAGGLAFGALVALAARSVNLVGDVGSCVITGAGGLIGYTVKGLGIASHNFQNLRPLVNAENRSRQLEEASVIADQGVALAKGEELSKYMFSDKLTQLYDKKVDYSVLTQANKEYKEAFENVKVRRAEVTSLYGGSHSASSAFIRSVSQGQIPPNTPDHFVEAARASLQATQVMAEKKQAMIEPFESFKASLAEPLREVESDIEKMKAQVEAMGFVQRQE
ncbi:hypothetical protein [Endozoicomonas numazuensis]|uniref:Uncharacterized protein n=1 Tax=Endozoicomonas numazuensis TaxID=1137799 RepID=A0A081NHW6_9GAMM|nr:hypothetical protein [Endozoicomonas numazuensis]KEQ18039.1 hypothetical protein GZ78_10650 [Endozoicomonas numazuensis]